MAIRYRKFPKKIVAGAALIAFLGAGAAQLAIEKIADYEGYVPEAYADPAGVLTICFGDTANVKKGMVETADACLKRLNVQIKKHAEPIVKCLPDLLNQPDEVVASMVSMAYNIGPYGFCKSSVAQYARKGDWRRACGRMAQIYTTAGGKTLKGLVSRRKSESELCLKGLEHGRAN